MKTTFLEFVWIWDKIQKLNIPQHHRIMGRFLSDLYHQKGRRQSILMAFRNSGKSTLVGLFCAWVLSQNTNLRLMVLSADYALAKKMVRHIKHILEQHPCCQKLKPHQKEEWASDKLTIERDFNGRDPSVLAKGISANITGCRADIILCDDVEVPKTCNTSAKREDLKQKLSELDYILAPDGLILYIGTPHTRETIYQQEGWQKLTLPIMDECGNPAWPERFARDKIEQIRKNTPSSKFLSQMMLQSVAFDTQRLDDKKLKFYPDELDYYEANGSAVLKIKAHRLVSGCAWWDPAFGKVGGDKSVVAAVFSDNEGNFYIHRLLYLTVPENEEATHYQCAQVALFLKDMMLPAIHLETNGIGRFLPALLRQELARQRLSVAVLEETSRQNKVERILGAWEPPLLNGNLYAHESVQKTPLIYEMQDFNPNGNSHDDGLDAIAGCFLSEPVRLKTIPQFYKHRPLWR